MAVLQSIHNETQEQIIARLMAQVEALKAQSKRKLTCKVTEKGAVSVYGLGRFPVTLYKGQWNRLIEDMPSIKAFIEANAADLSVKD